MSIKTLQQYEDEWADAYKAFMDVRDKLNSYTLMQRTFSRDYKNAVAAYSKADIQCIRTHTAYMWAVKNLKGEVE